MASSKNAAQDAVDRASALINQRRFLDALAPAREACALDPTSADGWRDLAIALKFAHRWAECLEACDRVVALAPEGAAGMHWNAGIAATALGRWARARAAWRAYGIQLPDGDGPLAMALGATGIRVSPDDRPEVVWCTRIDPCRAIVRSVPLPACGRRYGDLVLHDGERRGTRRLGDHDRPVFDELALLEASTFGTWEVVATCATPAVRDAVERRFVEGDVAIEDWTASIEHLCARCSVGTPHDHHDHDGEPAPWAPTRRFGLALRDDRELARLAGCDVVYVARIL
jgi:hypothetical protein